MFTEFRFRNITELLDHFKEKQTCINFLEQHRWAGNPTCPSCGQGDAYKAHPGYRCRSKGCSRKFSVLVGTIYENTKIPLRLWFAAIYLATTHKKGISSLQLAKDLNICQKTAWHLMHRIREVMYDADETEQMSGVVQSDEMFVGGLNSNRHHDKKYEYGNGRDSSDKTPVLGLYEDKGKVRTYVLPNTLADTIQPIIHAVVKDGSTLVTDSYSAYNGIDQEKDLKHVVVKHKDGGFVTTKNGQQFHTENIENFWSVFKRGYMGVYQYMSHQHLHRYCQEFTYRRNNLQLSSRDIFLLTVRQCNGRRLTFKSLTEKNYSERVKIRKTKTSEYLIDQVNSAIAKVSGRCSDWSIGMTSQKKVYFSYDVIGKIFNPNNREAILDAYNHFVLLGMVPETEICAKPKLLFVSRKMRLHKK